MNADILNRKKTAFVLWQVSNLAQPPALIIGQLKQGTPVTFVDEQQFPLQEIQPGLWSIDVTQCQLIEGSVYHYWFEVSDATAGRPGLRLRITDPMAYAVNWQLTAPIPDDPTYTSDDAYPAAVIQYSQGRLIPCDIGGEQPGIAPAVDLTKLSPNNRLVIYEVPTTWTRIGTIGEREYGVGTFSDVQALVDPDAAGGNFSDLPVEQPGRAYLTELGITAIELLPPADSFYKREWGYDTTNFCAPDFDLGYPSTYSWSATNRDFQALITACHTYGVRLFIDSVMAFSKQNPYLAAAPDDFFIFDPAADPSDPDAHNSRGTGPDNLRYGFGSTLFRYAAPRNGYDPVTGATGQFYPARQLMKTALLRWMNDFHIDGIRMDSVENVANWDFIEEYKDLAWSAWREQHPQGGDGYFLVVGEELTEPLSLLTQQRLNGLWHENFKTYIRYVICGQPVPWEITASLSAMQSALGQPVSPDDPAVIAAAFDTSVRKAIDCRYFGYTDLSEAVIYLTSHDVEGSRNMRLYNFLVDNGITDTEKYIKLAFACLLTAVGVPMILAGEEFADQHDLFDQQGNVDEMGGKQVDPVNYSRLSDPWRNEIKNYVSRLVACRTSNPALSVNDTTFIHSDFTESKRVLVWQRGLPGSSDIVVVLANFSAYGTPDPTFPSSVYIVPGWPETPAGTLWYEISQGYTVGAGWAGREPIYPWEAKVYTTVAPVAPSAPPVPPAATSPVAPVVPPTT
jgi:1,4-alpha-glucan branching enzyme